jgi:6-phosphogluconate dehydrogenase
MVHNGIEYADMQLICEAYDLMRQLLGLQAGEMSEVFAEWNRGELSSYLVGITADILSRTDPETGPLVDVIVDTAEQKGTGKWASQVALDLGVTAPTIADAVFARTVSAVRSERAAAAGVLAGPKLSFAANAPRSSRRSAARCWPPRSAPTRRASSCWPRPSREYSWDLPSAASPACGGPAASSAHACWRTSAAPTRATRSWPTCWWTRTSRA